MGQTKTSSAQGEFIFESDSQSLDECVTALGGVPLLLRAVRFLNVPGSVKRNPEMKQRDRGYDESKRTRRNLSQREVLAEFANARPHPGATLVEMLALLKCFDVQRMRQIGAIFQLIARHVCAVKPTFALPDLHYFRKTHGTEHFAHIVTIECGPVLAIAEDEIGKSTSQRFIVTRELITEPGDVLVIVSKNGIRQARHDDARSTTSFQNPSTLREHVLKFIGIQMLQHVCRIDGIDALRAEGKTIPNVQPQVNFLKWISINVHETLQVLGARA